MNIIYHAKVENGFVTDVRRVTVQRILENPDLYPGQWVEVMSMDQYPAVGWTWTAETGFQPPEEVEPEEVESE